VFAKDSGALRSRSTEKAVKKGIGVLPGAGILTNIYRLGRRSLQR